VVDDEARLLSEAGHDVEVLAPTVGSPSRWELLRTGARVIWSRDAAAEVREIIRRFSPDVVHAHNLFPGLSPSVLREVDGRVPLVMTLHNFRLICLPGVLYRDGKICEDCLGRVPWPGVIHGCYQGTVPASLALGVSLALHRSIATFDGVDLFLAISQFVRTKHIEGGLPPERVVVKPHFVWAGRLRKRVGEYFLYLGRLSREKGVDTLLAACRKGKTKLVIAGGGPEEPRLRSTAPPNVKFLGTVSPARAVNLISSARAILVPSLSYEAAGRVVLEAYASGVPALASKVGGLPEVVRDGVTGLLLPRGDESAWAEAMQRFDDSESERMGRNALQLWNQHYGPKTGLARLEEAYRIALAWRTG
jgi:glycosyltransferase involved in cell wall biosynthesis